MLLLNPPKNEGAIFVNTIAWSNFWHIPNSSRCPRYFRFWSAITFAQKLDSVSIISSYIGWAIGYGRCFGLFLFLFNHLGMIVIDCFSISFPKMFNPLQRQIHILRDNMKKPEAFILIDINLPVRCRSSGRIIECVCFVRLLLIDC